MLGIKPRALCVLGNFTFHLLICVSVHEYHSVCVGHRTSFRKYFFFPIDCVGPEDPAQAVSLGSNCLYALNNLVGPQIFITFIYFCVFTVVHVFGSSCGDQKITCKSPFSPSIMWMLGIKVTVKILSIN